MKTLTVCNSSLTATVLAQMGPVIQNEAGLIHIAALRKSRLTNLMVKMDFDIGALATLMT